MQAAAPDQAAWCSLGMCLSICLWIEDDAGSGFACVGMH